MFPDDGLPIGLVWLLFPFIVKRIEEEEEKVEKKKEVFGEIFVESNGRGVSDFKVTQVGENRNNRKEWKGGLMESWRQKIK